MSNSEKTEGNLYDKIFKENIEATFLPLSEKYFGIRIATTKEIAGDLQVTLERRPDFLKIVETPEGTRFILHIEFQTRDEKEMIYCMQEYFAILRKKYKLPVRQFVIYLGETPSKMRTDLEETEVFRKFELKSL